MNGEKGTRSREREKEVSVGEGGLGERGVSGVGKRRGGEGLRGVGRG